MIHFSLHTPLLIACGLSQTAFPDLHENIRIGDSVLSGRTLTRHDVISSASIWHCDSVWGDKGEEKRRKRSGRLLNTGSAHRRACGSGGERRGRPRRPPRRSLPHCYPSLLHAAPTRGAARAGSRMAWRRRGDFQSLSGWHTGSGHKKKKKRRWWKTHCATSSRGRGPVSQKIKRGDDDRARLWWMCGGLGELVWQGPHSSGWHHSCPLGSAKHKTEEEKKNNFFSSQATTTESFVSIS